MSLLKRALREGIRKGVGDAIGDAVRQAIEPTATQFANKAAQRLEQSTNAAADRVKQGTDQARRATGGLQDALRNLEQAAQGYATEMGKNMKVCPSCGQPTTAEKTFCPSCGQRLPEETLAAGAVCPSCGKQNSLTTKFCTDCGEKLPHVLRAEEEARAKDAAVLTQWQQFLPQYPLWSCGGTNLCLEQLEGGYMFSVTFPGDAPARAAVEEYRAVLEAAGFRQAGQYPCREHLYKMVGGQCFHVDTEHCFDGDGDAPCFYFSMDEPTGGFDYKEPQPKKQPGLKDLFRF